MRTSLCHALSLERLNQLCARPPVRIGISATQKPIEDMAAFLAAADAPAPSGGPAVATSRLLAVRADGTAFQAEVALFELVQPGAIH